MRNAHSFCQINVLLLLHERNLLFRLFIIILAAAISASTSCEGGNQNTQHAPANTSTPNRKSASVAFWLLTVVSVSGCSFPLVDG